MDGFSLGSQNFSLNAIFVETIEKILKAWAQVKLMKAESAPLA
jgi:hypothetical protein